MLRFDLPPVYSNVARIQALMTLLICLGALFGHGWLAGLLMVMGGVRGFVSPRRCPSHVMLERILLHVGAAGKKENAGAKMFADKLLFMGSSAVFLLWFVGSSLVVVPALVLSGFALADLLFGFCAGCWAYTLWHARRSS